MKTLFTHINRILEKITLKQALAAFFVGIIVLTAGPTAAHATEAKLSLADSAQASLSRITKEGETGRPRTTGQWQAENEALQGQPLDQLDRITEEAADAIGEMAEIYPQNVRTLTPGMDSGKLPRDD